MWGAVTSRAKKAWLKDGSGRYRKYIDFFPLKGLKKLRNILRQIIVKTLRLNINLWSCRVKNFGVRQVTEEPKGPKEKGYVSLSLPPPPHLDSPFGSATIIPKASFHFYPGKFYYLNYGCSQLESLLCYFANEKVNFSLAEQERKMNYFGVRLMWDRVGLPININTRVSSFREVDGNLERKHIFYSLSRSNVISWKVIAPDLLSMSTCFRITSFYVEL